MRKPVTQEVADQAQRNVLLVLTGPSGAGKDTIIAALLQQNPAFHKIVTTTSRNMREGESEGHPYHFISREEFETLIAEDAFYEWVEFRGEFYGTQKKTLHTALASGKDVIWKIEMKGIKNIKQKIKQHIQRNVFVFVTAPELVMLKERVYKAEGEAASLRWNEPLVVWELKQYEDCDYLVVNTDGELDQAVASVHAIVEAKRVEILSTK